MAAYDDIPAINTLYIEQANVDRAIEMLDAGGSISNFTVSPPPPDPGAIGAPMMAMSTMIATTAPSPELIADARAALVARHDEITAELAALGVTDSPPVMVKKEVEDDRLHSDDNRS